MVSLVLSRDRSLQFTRSLNGQRGEGECPMSRGDGCQTTQVYRGGPSTGDPRDPSISRSPFLGPTIRFSVSCYLDLFLTQLLQKILSHADSSSGIGCYVPGDYECLCQVHPVIAGHSSSNLLSVDKHFQALPRSGQNVRSDAETLRSVL